MKEAIIQIALGFLVFWSFIGVGEATAGRKGKGISSIMVHLADDSYIESQEEKA